jgi:hypothetical protein
MSGEQEIVVSATEKCTKAEWTTVVQTLNKMVAPLPRSPRQGIIQFPYTVLFCIDLKTMRP